MSGPLLCRNHTQCRPRFGDIWRCRRHVGDTSATYRAKPASRAATINQANQIVAKVLENTPLEFGVEWPGCGVVDIVLVGRIPAAAHRKKKIGLAEAGIS